MSTSKKNKNDDNRYEDLLNRIAETKHKHRVKLANLPFSEKIKILVKLQEIDNALAKAAGRKTGRIWEL